MSLSLSSRLATRLELLGTALALGRRVDLPFKVLVGTHHKTGTHWMKNVFRAIAHYHSLTMVHQAGESIPAEFDILFREHSRFDSATLQRTHRGLHMIRDPRDVIISGCFYHARAREPWLHQPQKRFRGLTYQQKLNSYSTLKDRLVFEMESVGRDTIEEMLRWDYESEKFLEIKYEDLISDSDLLLFHRALTFLGFPGSTVPSLLAIFFRNSIFSGSVHKSAVIRSARVKQWREHFRTAEGTRFLELFPDALVRLGYEEDDSWVADLPESVEATA